MDRRTTSAYDLAGRQTLRIDPRGYRTTYSYDALDRVANRKYPDASRVTFAYDAVGNRTQMRDSTGNYTYTYDAVDRTSQMVDFRSQVFTYSYDALGQRTRVKIPGGSRVTTSYDAAGQMATVINPAGDRTTFGYDAASRRTVERQADGMRTSMTYDAANQQIGVIDRNSGGTTVGRLTYLYDAAGNRTGRQELDGSRLTWTYDGQNQLLGENRTGTNAYRQDLRLRSRRQPDAEKRRCRPDHLQLRRRQPTGLRRRSRRPDDLHVRRRRQPAAGAHPDRRPDDRHLELRESTHPVPKTFGRTRDLPVQCRQSPRRRGGLSMAKRYFHWDVVDDCVMHETDENGDTIVEYTREPGPFGPLLSENRGGTESYHHYDALGSTTFLTDAAGNVTDTFAYDAWGNQVARTGTTPTPYTWVGRWGYQDDTATTGGYYVRARTYEPTVARWMSVDPVSHVIPPLWVPHIYLLLEYLYALNSPYGRRDPSGLQCKDVTPGEPFPPSPAPSSSVYRWDTNSFSANTLPLNMLAFFNACARVTGILSRPSCARPFWLSDDWVILSGRIVDDIRNQPGMLAEEQALETLLNGDSNSIAGGLDCGETQCFQRHGATQLQVPIGDDWRATNLGFTFGAYYVYYLANCNVGPAKDAGGGKCAADLRCSIRWTFYDVFNFDWYLSPMYLVGRPFKMSATWSSQYFRKLCGPDACKCHS